MYKRYMWYIRIHIYLHPSKTQNKSPQLKTLKELCTHFFLALEKRHGRPIWFFPLWPSNVRASDETLNSITVHQFWSPSTAELAKESYEFNFTIHLASWEQPQSCCFPLFSLGPFLNELFFTASSIISRDENYMKFLLTIFARLKD